MDKFLKLEGEAFKKNPKVMILKAFYVAYNLLPGIPKINYYGKEKWVDPDIRLSTGLLKRQYLTICCAFNYSMLFAESKNNSVKYNVHDGLGFNFSGDQDWLNDCISEINNIPEELEAYDNVLYLKPKLFQDFKGFSEHMYMRLKSLSGVILDITKIRLSSNKTDFKIVDIQSAEDFYEYGPGYKDIILETPDEKYFLLYNIQTGYIFLPGMDKAKRAEIGKALFEGPAESVPPFNI